MLNCYGCAKVNAAAAPDQNVLNFHKSLIEWWISEEGKNELAEEEYTTNISERNEL